MGSYGDFVSLLVEDNTYLLLGQSMNFRASCCPYLPKALPRELPVSQLTSGGSSTVRSMDVEIKRTHNLCNRPSWQEKHAGPE